MFGVKREGGGFEKIVWESVLETLPGGLILDIDGYTIPADGNIPAGTLVGKDPATGLGIILEDTTGDVLPQGYTIRTVKAEVNCLSEVGISGTIREKALPAGQSTLALRSATLPRITHV
jgi:hypothetical protein